MEVQRQKTLQAIANRSCGYYYEQTTDNFYKIPGCPVAYWASKPCIGAFGRGQLLSEAAKPGQGIKTGNNDQFLRRWHEIARADLGLEENDVKWRAYNKGGDYRQWYGNNDFVVNWENDGEAIRNFKDGGAGKLRSRPQNLNYMKLEGLTYTDISSSYFGVRYSCKGYIFDASGSMIFSADNKWLFCLLGKLAPFTLFEARPMLTSWPTEDAAVRILYAAGNTAAPLIRSRGFAVCVNLSYSFILSRMYCTSSSVSSE